MFIAESASEKKLKSVNISQSYKQERDCLVHFLRPLAVCWPGYMGSGIGPEAYNVTAACRSETIATQQLAVRRRHVSYRSISQRQHTPAGDGQHCNMGCSE